MQEQPQSTEERCKGRSWCIAATQLLAYPRNHPNGLSLLAAGGGGPLGDMLFLDATLMAFGKDRMMLSYVDWCHLRSEPTMGAGQALRCTRGTSLTAATVRAGTLWTST